MTEPSSALQTRPFVELGSNENALGPSPTVASGVAAVVRSGHRYPRQAALGLRTMIAEANDVSVDDIFITNGSADALLAIGATHLQPGDRTVVAQPTFYLHVFMTERPGGELSSVETKDFHQDVDGLIAAIDDRTRLVVITNPHSPTGSVVDQAGLDRIVAAIESRGDNNIALVIDEAYSEYADPSVIPDGVALVRAGHNVVVTRTFSKAYGLAGMRIGYAIASTSIADRLRRYLPPFAVNAASVAAAEAAFADTDHLSQVVEVNNTQKTRLSEALSRLGMAPAPSQANFVVATGLQDPEGIVRALAEERIIVRATEEDFGLPGGLRFTTGTEEETTRVIEALEALDPCGVLR